MTPGRRRAWLVSILLAPVALLVLAVLWIAIFGWNWARGPLQDLTARHTGRSLRIGGDLSVAWAWPVPHLLARDVAFANPAWAREPQMVQADAVDLGIDLPELLQGRLAFPSVQLTRPRLFLEEASGGRKTWLLDLGQTDESAVVPIGSLGLDRGEASYLDAARETSLLATFSTRAGAAPDRNLLFAVKGRWQGAAVTASGSGASLLAWRNEAMPYPLQMRASLGRTSVRVDGSVTGLRKFSAVDVALELRGASLADLFPVIGLALPPTPPYVSHGHLRRQGAVWRYDDFEAQIANSDLSGSLTVDTSSARPRLTAMLSSRQLALADLRPAIGAQGVAPAQAPAVAARAVSKLLPELPVDTTRWASLDADVTLRAQVLKHSGAVPLSKLDVHLILQDRQMSLKPFRFGLAGGEVSGEVSLDARQDPTSGRLQARLQGLRLEKWFPATDSKKTSIGRVDGVVDVAGRGRSVGQMFAKSDGRISLVAQSGRVSRLLMEQTGLHLLEILQLSLTGDESITLNCAVADFSIQAGTMRAHALLLDTAVNTVVGDGTIDLAQETLDLRLVPRTRVNSIVALRGPVHVQGSLLHPKVSLDAGRIAARGAGALLLGAINPLLALLPLFEAGPGEVSECGRWVREAQTRSTPKKAAPVVR